MDPETRAQFVEDMFDWLRSLPEETEVATYIRSLDQDGLKMLVEIQAATIEKVYWNKRKYYVEHGLAEVADTLPANDELVFLSYAAEYNVVSVQQRFAQQFSSIAQLTFPQDFATWAGEYCQFWYVLTYFRAYPEFLQQSQLIHSILSLRLSPQQIGSLLTELRQEVAADLDRYRQGRDLSTMEKDQLKALFGKFSFLPKQYIEEIIEPFALERKKILLGRLINVLVILAQHSFATDQEADDFLLEQIRIGEEQNVLTALEDLRKGQQTPSDFINYLNRVLPRLWDASAVQSGQSFAQLKQYVLNLNQQQRERFLRQLYASMRRSLEVQVYVDPIDPAYLVNRLQSVRDETQLDQFIREMLELITEPRQRSVAQATIKLFYQITHTYPEPQ